MYHQVLHPKILHGDHTLFVCSAWISEQTVTFSLYGAERYVFSITEVESVDWVVCNESLYKTDMFRFVIHTVHFLTFHILNQQNALIKIQ